MDYEYKGLRFYVGTSNYDLIMFELEDINGYLGEPQGYTIYLNYRDFLYSEYIGDDGFAVFENTVGGNKFYELLDKGENVVPELINLCNNKIKNLFIMALQPLGDIDYSKIEGFDECLDMAKKLSREPLSIIWKETVNANKEHSLNEIRLLQSVIKKNENNNGFYSEEENTALNFAIISRVTEIKDFIKKLENTL